MRIKDLVTGVWKENRFVVLRSSSSFISQLKSQGINLYLVKPGAHEAALEKLPTPNLTGDLTACSNPPRKGI